jgi:hypothetical protein
MRAVISRIPDGTCAFEDRVDDPFLRTPAAIVPSR